MRFPILTTVCNGQVALLCVDDEYGVGEAEAHRQGLDVEGTSRDTANEVGVGGERVYRDDKGAKYKG